MTFLKIYRDLDFYAMFDKEIVSDKGVFCENLNLPKIHFWQHSTSQRTLSHKIGHVPFS